MRAFATVCFFVLLAASIPVTAQEVSERERYGIDEQIFLKTIADQGGRSHASGERPEFGPVQWQVTPRGDVPPIRVGITPTQFASNGSVLQEYWTAAAHNHGVVE